jgi:hypothetical protein
MQPADHECDGGIGAQVRRLSRAAERVENDLEIVGDGDANDCGLCGEISGDARLATKRSLRMNVSSSLRVIVRILGERAPTPDRGRLGPRRATRVK